MGMTYEFTQADLKDGMMIEDIHGERWIYLGGKMRKSNICAECNPTEIFRVGYPHYEEYYTINELIAGGFSRIIFAFIKEKEISSEEAFAVLKQHYGCDVKIKE